MCNIPINLVFEDSLSGSVLCRLLANSRQKYLVGLRYNSGGFGGIKKRINGFNHAAKGMPYLILTDLDRNECPPRLLEEWLVSKKHPNLIFRVAVRQVESWLLACHDTFAKFVGIREGSIPHDVDQIEDSKKYLIDLVKQSRKTGLRSDIVPAQGSTARVGPDYNGRLIDFVERLWDPDVARERSPSLRKAIELLDSFEPVL